MTAVKRHPLRPLVYPRGGMWWVVRWRSSWAVEVLWVDLDRDAALAWARQWAGFHRAWLDWGGTNPRSTPPTPHRDADRRR